MEPNREQIIKALECCTYGGDITKSQAEVCSPCPYFHEGNCTDILKENALSLIKELTEQVEKDNKTIIDLYHEAETYLAQRDCLRNQVKNLTEENERLKARVLEENHLRHQAEEMLANGMSVVKADTVRKMHSEIKERCIKGGIYPAFVKSTIDQIAKEMLEGEK